MVLGELVDPQLKDKLTFLEDTGEHVETDHRIRRQTSGFS